MNASPTNDPGRILVVGRSPSVLVDTVEILRGKGYSADATNQFDRVLDDYDAEDLDVVVFGGMVPADTKQRLRQEIRERNAHVMFVQGLAGIAGLMLWIFLSSLILLLGAEIAAVAQSVRPMSRGSDIVEATGRLREAGAGGV